MLLNKQRRRLLLCSSKVLLLDNCVLDVLAQNLGKICEWGGSNLDANPLQSGSVLDAIQHCVRFAVI